MKIINKISFLLLCLCVSAATFSQSDSAFSFIKTIPGSYTNFDVDNLDNIFLITENNTLKKINTNGDPANVFNEVKRFGNLSNIDVTNPLKILLYYKDFAKVAVLDRFLNIRNVIDFRKQNIFSVQCIATSYDNDIWIFDDQDYKLKKINEDGSLLLETIDFRQLFDSTPSPTQIIDKENAVYLYDPEKGFYIFDYYGSFKNKLSLPGWSNVSVSQKNIYGFTNNTLNNYNLNTLNLSTFQLPGFLNNYSSIKAINGKLYLLKSDGLYIYQLKQ